MNKSTAYHSRSAHARIFWALLCRDLKVFKQKLGGTILDSIMPLLTQVLLFGKFFPLLGLPPSLIAPLYLGFIPAFSMFYAFNLGLRTIYDIKFNRFIDYHLTLPLPKRWLFAEYVVYFIIQAASVTLPLVSIGIIMLGKNFVIINANWPLFIISYLLMLTFYGSLFLALSLYYSFFWYRYNIWPRRLTFLLSFSATFFTWKSIYSFSPLFGYIFLLNPLTYAAESLRATLIGGDEFLPATLCIPVLILSSILAVGLLSRGIKNRLDPV